MQNHPPYEITDDLARVDRDAVCRWLTTEAYWGRWRSSADIERQIESAWRVVAAIHRGSGDLVGFARAWSDGVGTAYLADVFVVAEHRGQGLGKAIVHAMIDDGPGAGFRWMLHTADAHGLYARAGFGPPDETYLERPATR